MFMGTLSFDAVKAVKNSRVKLSYKITGDIEFEVDGVKYHHKAKLDSGYLLFVALHSAGD